MSLSDEQLDELLSASMDDALSDSEQTELQQLLASDASVARRLDEMQELSAAVRALGASPQPRLGNRFADLVIDQAVTTAIAENLSDEHPVVMLVGQPAQRTPSMSPVRVAAAIAALAASVALVWFVGPGRDADPEQQLVASGTLPPEQPILASSDLRDPNSSQPVAPEIKSDAGVRSVPEPEMLAVDSAARPDVNSSEPSRPANGLTPRIEIPADDSLNLGRLKSMASAGPGLETLPTELNSGPLSGFVAILRITRTETGRERGAARRAMERASFSDVNQKEVTNEIVSAVVASADQTPSSESSLLYVEAPATQFDKLVNALLEDTQGIKSVSFGVVTDAPVVKLVGALRTDPTTVRHDVSWELTGADGVPLDTLNESLNAGTFATLDRDTAAANLGAVTATSGPNVSAKMLLLVK